ncbi:hypothetical protein BC567DRAFT_214082 [Phyllosticta citribraziliensis]
MLTYPNVDDAVFNYDYYLQTHMPLAEQVWRPLGLVGYRAVKCVPFSLSPPQIPKPPSSCYLPLTYLLTMLFVESLSAPQPTKRAKHLTTSSACSSFRRGKIGIGRGRRR